MWVTVFGVVGFIMLLTIVAKAFCSWRHFNDAPPPQHRGRIGIGFTQQVR